MSDAQTPSSSKEGKRLESPTKCPPDLTAAFSNLTLEASAPLPTVNQCIAHLKLLESIHILREDTGYTDGLFGIYDKFADPGLPEEDHQHDKALAQIREKRWALYVARAADRFETWWHASVPTTKGGVQNRRLVQSDLSAVGFERISTSGKPIEYTCDNLPPLDILMVWHAYMLNPRCFFEDCIRYGKLDLWATGLPWAAVNACIDNSSFEYRTSEEANRLFETSSGRAWDNLRDVPEKPLECPRCLSTTAFPWTTSTVELPCTWDRLEKVLTDEGRGYGDKDFSAGCAHCDFVFSHEKLRVLKFKRDVQLLLNDDCPMPGTILSMDGKPIDAKAVGGVQNHLAPFPNRLLHAESSKWLELIADHKRCFNDMNGARSYIELALHDKNLTRRLKGTSSSWKVISEAEIAVRRMMSRYWDNHSMFALDLVGAVIRQGSFIEKMHNIDWLHSPTLSSTMTSLIHKYTRFFEIMRRKKMSRIGRRIAVPTLDIDLAWHTHQLSPPNYYGYSDDMTKSFIDHDDKIAQDALSDAFKWTSHTYQKMFGQVYSECICWYCEAIRESHTSIVPVPRIVRSASATAAERFHAQNPCGDGIPRACDCPHISAHNAVKPDFGKNSTVSDAAALAAGVHVKQLERAFQKACRRATTKGRKAPVREEYHGSNAYSAYGPRAYPIAVPYSLPYAADACTTANMYPSNPAGMVVAPGGAAGFCVAGACGGTVAAGACVGGCGGGTVAAGARVGGRGGGGSPSGGCGDCGGCGGCGG